MEAKNTSPHTIFSVILPGMLIAATGVGAGDLATASLVGSQLGLTILWACIVGGLFKFVLTEGLARWQLASGSTLLEGIAKHFGAIFGWLFLPYLLLWSFFVSTALMSASGVALHALIPVFDDPTQAKVVFGIVASLLGLLIVTTARFRRFEQVMTVCIGLMFITVLITAGLLWPSTGQVLSGLFVPQIPNIAGDGIDWTVALIGGVGGTLTIMCYGYWIREKGRLSPDDISTCRIDLSAGYGMTILFSLAMVIIGSHIDIQGKGASLLVTLADSLAVQLGDYGRGLFLVGAFCAIFSSLLGVWQAVPYLFADFWRLFFSAQQEPSNIRQGKPYKVFQLALAIIPMAGLFLSFKEAQKLYAITGAFFIPLLSVALLILNGRKQWVNKHTNSTLFTTSLLVILCFSLTLAWLKWFS